MRSDRRSVLKMGAFGAGMTAAGFTLPLGGRLQGRSASELASRHFPVPYQRTFQRPPEIRDRTSIELIQTPTAASIVRGGLITPLMTFNGTFPGPTIRVNRGTPVQVTIRNRLPQLHPQWTYRMDTSTHLHGSPSLPQYDGYANDVTFPAYRKTYHYPNTGPARTMWYHDHAVHHTAQNAYSGLAAQYIVHDDAERNLLPQGEFDVPVTVTDAMFDSRGRLAYDDESHSGLWGDVILVNGVPWPTMKVKRRVYRFRLLNASISRSYRFQLSTRDPVTMVATDGGLMPTSQQVGSWRHAGAERYEILIDFAKYRPGQRVELRNLSNDNNRDYDHTMKVMAFDVTDEPFDTSDPSATRVPTTLVGSEPMTLKASQSRRTRRFRLHRSNGIWKIGDQSWQQIVDSGYTKALASPALNDIEIWEFENSSGGWFHPLHIHLVDFQILARNGRQPFSYERGPKDVVYTGENETIRLIMKFGPHKGRYMVHCHNLPHEDHDMMSQFIVGLAPGEADPNDPIEADPCVPD